MSSLIFPVLPGQRFTKRKTPTYDTLHQRAISGKESRQSARAYPLYSWELEYNFLSDNFSQGPARTNYVAYSQDATQWGASYGGSGLPPIVVGDYALAPNGTLTASRVILNIAGGSTSGDFAYVSMLYSSVAATQTYTVSVWLKTNDGSTISVYASGANLGGLWTVTPQWQQFSRTWTPSAASNATLYLGGASGSAKYADISVWGAQVEPGPYPTAYIPTNGAPIRQSDLKTVSGFVSQMLGSYDTFLYQDPDFNTVQLQQFATGNGSTTAFNLTATYQPGAEIVQYGSPAPVLGPAGTPEWIQNTNGAPRIYTARYGGAELLSAASRTNLLLQSDFAASWSNSGLAITANAATAPDGTSAAASFNEGTSAATHYVLQNVTITGGARYTFSVWLKYSSRQYVALYISGGSDYPTAVFDLVNGVASSTALIGAAYASAADVEMEAFPSGWYRCSISGQLAAADTSVNAIIGATNSFTPGALLSFTGTNGVFYGWGAQFESGTQVTALIPTTTASATNGGSDYSLTNLTTAGSVYTFQQVSFNSAPANNVPLLWSGSFYYRCRFSEDSCDFQNDMSGLWSLQKLSFQQVIL